MYKQIIVLILFATVINAQTTGWRNCVQLRVSWERKHGLNLCDDDCIIYEYKGSYLGSIEQIRIPGCSQTPCTFRRGESYFLDTDVNSYANSNTLPFRVTATSLGVELPIHSGNACDYLTSGECPITNGRRFSFGILYEVPQWLPPVPTVVNGLVWNDFGDLAVCVQFDAIVN